MNQYTEDILVHQTTADNLLKRGGQSAYAFNDVDFVPRSILGQGSDREMV